MEKKTNAEIFQILCETLGKIDDGEISSKEVRTIAKQAREENRRRDALLKSLTKQLMDPNITSDERAALQIRFNTET